MTLKKMALVAGFILGAGVLAGSIAYAQGAFDSPFDLQDQGTDRTTLSFFVDGGYLGVATEEITKENMARYGLRDVRGVGITQVIKDSPAEKAGLRKDDVIVRFDGETVTSVRKLTRLIGEVSPDQTIKLTISRGGAEQEVSATVSKRNNLTNVFGPMIKDDVIRGIEQSWPRVEMGGNDWPLLLSVGANRRIGVSTQTLTKQLADYFGVKDGGLLVTSVTDDSPAAKAGLKAGDVITTADGEKVDDSGDLSRAINKKEDGSVTLTVIRDRNSRSVTITPEKRQERTIRSGTIGRRITIPAVEIPTIPEINITVPRVVVPATPRIDVTVPRTVVRPGRVRTVII